MICFCSSGMIQSTKRGRVAQTTGPMAQEIVAPMQRENIAPLPERIEHKIDRSGECHIWTGWVKPDGGYGLTSYGGRTRVVHRLVWELCVGPIPEGYEIDHVKARGCTSRACVRLDHLEPVTPVENKRRAGLVGMGAVNAAKETCPNGHRYDRVNVRGQRYCRTCFNAHQNRRRRKGHK